MNEIFQTPVAANSVELAKQGFRGYGVPPQGGLNGAWALNTGVNLWASELPQRKDFESEKKWRIECVRYFAQKASDRVGVRHMFNKVSIDAYNAFTGNTKSPYYAETGEGFANSSMRYEYLNSLAHPINVRMGEFVADEYRTKAYVTNSQAKSRKEEYYRQKLFEGILEQMPNARAAMEQAGIQTQTSPAIPPPETPDESLESRIERSYKDTYAERADILMREWVADSDFKRVIWQSYRTYLLTNSVFFLPRLNPSTLKVELEYLDPNQCIFDADITDDFGANQQYFMHLRYESINSVLKDYPHVKREDLLKANRAGGMAYNFFWGYPVYKVINSQDYILVARARWKMTETTTLGEYLAQRQAVLSREEFDKIKAGQGPKELKEKITYEEVYECTLAAGELELDGGIMMNQVRSVDALSKADLGVYMLCLNYALDPLAPTMAMHIEALTQQRNLIMYKVMAAVADMKGVMLVLNPASVPTDAQGQPDLQSFLRDMMANKIIWDNSAEYITDLPSGMGPKGMPSVSQVVHGLPPDIMVLIEIAASLSAEIDKQMSFSTARSGNTQRYETASATSMNKTQSDFGTLYQDMCFDETVEKMLSYIANLENRALFLRKATAMKMQNTMLEDALQIKFGDDVLLAPPDDFLFQDIGVRVKRMRNQNTLRQQIYPALEQALMAGHLTPVDLIDFVLTDDPADAAAKMQARIRESEVQKQKLAEQQMQMQQQQQQQMIQSQMMMQQNQLAAQQNLKAQEGQDKMAIEKMKKDLDARNAIIENSVKTD